MAEVLENIEGSTDRVSARFLELNSCGRQELHGRDYVRLRPDGRSDYHILYITAGRCTVEDAAGTIRAVPGDLILYRPHEPQKYSFRKEDRSVSCYIHFSGTGCEDLLETFGFTGQRVAHPGLSNTLETLFNEMESEYIQMKPFSREILSGILMQFLAAAARLSSGGDRITKPSAAGSMKMICDYIYNHYDENRPIGFYASMCSLSTDRFSHAFTEEIGVSPKNYILQTKIVIAERLLSTGKRSVNETASLVGIEDPSYFTRVFKKYTGHTPGYYKKS